MYKEARLGDLLASRPVDARKRIYSAFNGQDCLKCGKCCRKDKAEPFRLTFIANDPALSPIRRKISEAATGRKVAMTGVRNNIVMIRSTGPECVFFEQGTNKCDIYEDRPIVCKAFPFIVLQSNAVAFSTFCPPILELQRRGIEFLYMSDISRPLADVFREKESYPDDIQRKITEFESRGESPQGDLNIKFLANCLIGMAEMLKSFQAGLSNKLDVAFDYSRNEGVFPIW